MRFFHVINIFDRNLSAIIEGIRIIANPYVKQSAHITVGGPFDVQTISKKILKEIEDESDKVKDKEIVVGGVRNFFKFNQNTIYLPCFSKALEKVWKKSDFGFNPHLTLYDGDDKGFAKRLYDELKNVNIFFSFNIERVEILTSIKSQLNSNFINSSNLLNNISYYLGKEITYDAIVSLSEVERIEYIKKLCSFFNNWQKVGAFPSPINDLFKELGVNEDNGLFYFSEIKKWEKRFPFRVTKALKGIKPFAIFSLFKNIDSVGSRSHLKPFNQPIILFFDNPSKDEIPLIHRQVFSFGLSPIIFINFVDDTQIYNGLSFQDKKQQGLKLIGNRNNIKEFSFHNLFISERWKDFYSSTFKNSKRIDDYLLQNLTNARYVLINKLGLSPSIANRLIGRLLFIRYLIDRDVEFRSDNEARVEYFPGKGRDQRNLNFVETILKKNRIYSFFSFLEKKLGGELFPVSENEIKLVENKHLEVMYYLFKGERLHINNTYSYEIQGSLFDIYDFKIIPIELISNIYESFMGEEKRLANKAFYTPPFLVDYVLSQTLEKHLENDNGLSTCKVLDPSCGSGIFLIEAARKLIEKKIEASSKRKLKNNDLWHIISNNIFGIDIDPDAIDVAIFSLYVTILDYKEPKEISEKFRLKNLKGVNFFSASDFFDLSNNYNNVLKDIKFDFIIGNPPWGKVKASSYVKYCQIRERTEKVTLGDNFIPIGLSDEQIAQAFLIRASDFMSASTKCAFVVTSKLLYNSNAKAWRNYFLSKFKVTQVMDLSAVRNYLFDGAGWPAAILFYELGPQIENVIKHISIKPNRFFRYFKSVVVEKHDYKLVPQKYFMEDKGGVDWLWKTLLYGNLNDASLIFRLKSLFPTIFEIIRENNLEFGVGLKRKDGDKVKNAEPFIGLPFIDTGNKELNRFHVNATKYWKESTAANIPRLRNGQGVPILFKGPLALVKEGLDPGYKSVAAYVDNDCVFTHSIRAITGTTAQKDLLKGIVGILNSELFSYYIFLTGTSTGVDFIRANQIEQFSFPCVINENICFLVEQLHEINSFGNDKEFYSVEIEVAKQKIESYLNLEIRNAYGISEMEYDLIRYVLEVSIPLTNTKLSGAVHSLIGELNAEFLDQYIQVFFLNNPNIVQADVYINSEIICIAFKYEKFLAFNEQKNEQINHHFVQNDDFTFLDQISSLSFVEIAKQLFVVQDLVETNGDYIYIIKPNEKKNWHSAIAWLDVLESSANSNKRNFALA